SGIKKLLSWGLKNIAITLGNRGSRITDGKRMIESGIYDVVPTDTTGAGDAFASGFIYGVINNLSLEDMAKYASALSSLEISGMGVRKGLPENLDDLKKFIDNNKLKQTELQLS
ncbi:MAG: carbohydrate kinase family protein, partial [archaeon]|nr:carbohydrate kinase family protein [archaeon]